MGDGNGEEPNDNCQTRGEPVDIELSTMSIYQIYVYVHGLLEWITGGACHCTSVVRSRSRSSRQIRRVGTDVLSWEKMRPATVDDLPDRLTLPLESCFVSNLIDLSQAIDIFSISHQSLF